jgi:hypothetical protein
MLSLYVLWATRVAPFKLKVLVIGRVEFIRIPPPNLLPRISMRLLFVNEGARRGYVDNVALAVSDAHSTKSPLFFGALFEDVAEINYAEAQQKSPEWVAFSSFCLGPGESLVKRVVFLPNDADIKFFPEAGDCSLTPYTVKTGDHNWKRWKTVTVVFSEKDIETLSTNFTPLSATGHTLQSSLISLPLKHRVALLARLETNFVKRSSSRLDYLFALLFRRS